MVQKVAHEFMGILLLVAPETNRNSLSRRRPRCPTRQKGEAVGRAAARSERRAQRGARACHPHLLHVLHTKLLNKKKKFYFLKTQNIKANWTVVISTDPTWEMRKTEGQKRGLGRDLPKVPQRWMDYTPSLLEGPWTFPLSRRPLYKMLKC